MEIGVMSGSSGSFDCVRRNYPPDFAQDDLIFAGLDGVQDEVEGVQNRAEKDG